MLPLLLEVCAFSFLSSFIVLFRASFLSTSVTLHDPPSQLCHVNAERLQAEGLAGSDTGDKDVVVSTQAPSRCL